MKHAHKLCHQMCITSIVVKDPLLHMRKACTYYDATLLPNHYRHVLRVSPGMACCAVAGRRRAVQGVSTTVDQVCLPERNTPVR
jgi:hypothetical protein